MASPVTVQLSAKGDWALVQMAKEPVNTLDTALWQALADAIYDLEAKPGVRGVIIASGLKRDIFTAGNDINELFAPKTSEKQHSRFWQVSNVFLARLYRSPLFTVAAIRGACPAAGCAISMCCDMTVMTETGYIGLNEVALGIPVPVYWAELFMHKVGGGRGETLLKSGSFLKPNEAKAAGLVDDVVPKDDLMATAESWMASALKLPDVGRQGTKAAIRSDLSQRWEHGCVEEGKAAWRDLLSQPATVNALGAILQSLSRSKSSTTRSKL